MARMPIEQRFRLAQRPQIFARHQFFQRDAAQVRDHKIVARLQWLCQRLVDHQPETRAPIRVEAKKSCFFRLAQKRHLRTVKPYAQKLAINAPQDRRFASHHDKAGLSLRLE